MKKCLIIIFILFFITGCYDCQELNNINIVTGIGFDYIDSQYMVSLEVTKNKDDEKEITIFTAKDSDLATAMSKVKNNSDKKTFFKHVDTILISEELAKRGISEIIDYLLRDSNISTTFFTVICDNAYELLNKEVKGDTISNLIVTTINSHINAEILNNVDIIASDIINNRKDIALPYVEIDDENKILIENKAYFNGVKMIKTISNKIYNFLYLGNKNIVFNSDNNVLNVYDKKIKYDVLKDKIVINIQGEGRIVSVNKDMDLNDKNNFIEFEKMINKKIEEEVNEFLDETLSNDSDLIGLEDLYYKKYRVNKENIKYEVKSNVRLIRNGVITEVING